MTTYHSTIRHIFDSAGDRLSDINHNHNHINNSNHMNSSSTMPIINHQSENQSMQKQPVSYRLLLRPLFTWTTTDPLSVIDNNNNNNNNSINNNQAIYATLETGTAQRCALDALMLAINDHQKPHYLVIPTFQSKNIYTIKRCINYSSTREITIVVFSLVSSLESIPCSATRFMVFAGDADPEYAVGPSTGVVSSPIKAAQLILTNILGWNSWSCNSNLDTNHPPLFQCERPMRLNKIPRNCPASYMRLRHHLEAKMVPSDSTFCDTQWHLRDKLHSSSIIDIMVSIMDNRIKFHIWDSSSYARLIAQEYAHWSTQALYDNSNSNSNNNNNNKLYDQFLQAFGRSMQSTPFDYHRGNNKKKTDFNSLVSNRSILGQDPVYKELYQLGPREIALHDGLFYEIVYSHAFGFQAFEEDMFQNHLFNLLDVLPEKELRFVLKHIVMGTVPSALPAESSRLVPVIEEGIRILSLMIHTQDKLLNDLRALVNTFKLYVSHAGIINNARWFQIVDCKREEDVNYRKSLAREQLRIYSNPWIPYQLYCTDATALCSLSSYDPTSMGAVLNCLANYLYMLWSDLWLLVKDIFTPIQRYQASAQCLVESILQIDPLISFRWLDPQDQQTESQQTESPHLPLVFTIHLNQDPTIMPNRRVMLHMDIGNDLLWKIVKYQVKRPTVDGDSSLYVPLVPEVAVLQDVTDLVLQAFSRFLVHLDYYLSPIDTLIAHQQIQATTLETICDWSSNNNQNNTNNHHNNNNSSISWTFDRKSIQDPIPKSFQEETHMFKVLRDLLECNQTRNSSWAEYTFYLASVSTFFWFETSFCADHWLPAPVEELRPKRPEQQQRVQSQSQVHKPTSNKRVTHNHRNKQQKTHNNNNTNSSNHNINNTSNNNNNNNNSPNDLKLPDLPSNHDEEDLLAESAALGHFGGLNKINNNSNNHNNNSMLVVPRKGRPNEKPVRPTVSKDVQSLVSNANRIFDSSNDSPSNRRRKGK